jgi:hypothetical protein
MSALTRYLNRCGVEFDVAVNVLTGGNLGETVSLRAATGAIKKHIRGWCLFCRFLNLVQEDHCALQFTDLPQPESVEIRAGVAFIVGISAIGGIGFSAWQIIRGLV